MRMSLLPQPGAHAFAGRMLFLQHEPYLPSRLRAGEASLSLALLQSVGCAMAPGHDVRLIENGAIFDELVEGIRGARESVHVLVYIWRPSAPSERLIEALCDSASRGVRCRVVVDPVGSEEISGQRDFDLEVEKRLSNAGIQVHYYRLLAHRRTRRIVGRNHQKLVIVDGRVGFTGGFGIWKTWEGDGRSEEHWRDTHVRVEGPAVRQMQLAFARAWQESGGELLPSSVFVDDPGRDAGARAAFVASSGRYGVTDAERMYRLVFGAARHRLLISNSYFNPPDAVLTLLEDKRRQGVDVRVLAPGPFHDVPPIRAAQRSTYPRLLRAGVRIWEYQPTMFHAKTVVVDDWLTVIGSTNLDTLSLNTLEEGSLVVADAALNQQLAGAWERDLRHAKEITRARTGPLRRAARRVTELFGSD